MELASHSISPSHSPSSRSNYSSNGIQEYEDALTANIPLTKIDLNGYQFTLPTTYIQEKFPILCAYLKQIKTLFVGNNIVPVSSYQIGEILGAYLIDSEEFEIDQEREPYVLQLLGEALIYGLSLLANISSQFILRNESADYEKTIDKLQELTTSQLFAIYFHTQQGEISFPTNITHRIYKILSERVENSEFPITSQNFQIKYELQTLSDEEFIFVSYFLRKWIQGKCLKLKENKLSYISTIAVVDGVVNSSIEDLQIVSNSIRVECVQHLAKYIADSKCSLQYLLLKNCEVNSEGGTYIAEALTINTSMKYLNLENNEIETECGRQFINCLMANSTLEHLYLGDNKLTVEMYTELMEKLPMCAHIKHIDLGKLEGNEEYSLYVYLFQGKVDLSEITLFKGKNRIKEYEIVEKQGDSFSISNKFIVHKNQNLFTMQELIFPNVITMSEIRDYIEIISKINHPNIGQIHDIFCISSTLYIVYNGILQKAEDIIKELPAENKELKILLIIQQIITGITILNSIKFPHLMIKPSNIGFIHTYNTENLVVKIVGMGLYPFLIPNSNEKAQLLTPYNSPEIWNNLEELNCDSDIFGIGCILQYLLTMTQPFNVNSQGTPIWVYDHSKLRGISDGVKGLVKGMLEINKADRITLPRLRERIEELIGEKKLDLVTGVISYANRENYRERKKLRNYTLIQSNANPNKTILLKYVSKRDRNDDLEVQVFGNHYLCHPSIIYCSKPPYCFEDAKELIVIEASSYITTNLSSYLLELRRQHQHPSKYQILSWGMQIIDGISYAHLHQVANINLSPSQIFLTPNNHIKLFGFQKIVPPDGAQQWNFLRPLVWSFGGGNTNLLIGAMEADILNFVRIFYCICVRREYNPNVTIEQMTMGMCKYKFPQGWLDILQAHDITKIRNLLSREFFQLQSIDPSKSDIVSNTNSSLYEESKNSRKYSSDPISEWDELNIASCDIQIDHFTYKGSSRHSSHITPLVISEKLSVRSNIDDSSLLHISDLTEGKDMKYPQIMRSYGNKYSSSNVSEEMELGDSYTNSRTPNIMLSPHILKQKNTPEINMPKGGDNVIDVIDVIEAIKEINPLKESNNNNNNKRVNKDKSDEVVIMEDLEDISIRLDGSKKESSSMSSGLSTPRDINNISSGEIRKKDQVDVNDRLSIGSGNIRAEMNLRLFSVEVENKLWDSSGENKLSDSLCNKHRSRSLERKEREEGDTNNIYNIHNIHNIYNIWNEGREIWNRNQEMDIINPGITGNRRRNSVDMGVLLAVPRTPYQKYIHNKIMSLGSLGRLGIGIHPSIKQGPAAIHISITPPDHDNDNSHSASAFDEEYEFSSVLPRENLLSSHTNNKKSPTITPYISMGRDVGEGDLSKTTGDNIWKMPSPSVISDEESFFDDEGSVGSEGSPKQVDIFATANHQREEVHREFSILSNPIFVETDSVGSISNIMPTKGVAFHSDRDSSEDCNMDDLNSFEYLETPIHTERGGLQEENKIENIMDCQTIKIETPGDSDWRARTEENLQSLSIISSNGDFRSFSRQTVKDINMTAQISICQFDLLTGRTQNKEEEVKEFDDFGSDIIHTFGDTDLYAVPVKEAYGDDEFPRKITGHKPPLPYSCICTQDHKKSQSTCLIF